MKIANQFFGACVFVSALLVTASPVAAQDDACTQFRTPPKDDGAGGYGRYLEGGDFDFDEIARESRDIQACLDIMPAKYPGAWYALMTTFAWHGLPHPDIVKDGRSPDSPNIAAWHVRDALNTIHPASDAGLPARGACAMFRAEGPLWMRSQFWMHSHLPVSVNEPSISRCLSEMAAIYPGAWQYLQKLTALRGGMNQSVRPAHIKLALSRSLPTRIPDDPDEFFNRTYSDFDRLEDDTIETYEAIEVAQTDTAPPTLERAERLHALYRRYQVQAANLLLTDPQVNDIPEYAAALRRTSDEIAKSLEQHEPLLLAMRKAAAANAGAGASRSGQPLLPTVPATTASAETTNPDVRGWRPRWPVVGFAVVAAMLGMGVMATRGRLFRPRHATVKPARSNPLVALVPRKWRKADAYFRSLFEKHFDPEIGLFPNTSVRWKVYGQFTDRMEQGGSFKQLRRAFAYFHPDNALDRDFSRTELTEIMQYFNQQFPPIEEDDAA